MRSAKRTSAYLTVYLALTMAVLLSLCLALIEGVRQDAVFLEAECVTDIGLNSILAEYHKELFRQYNLFAIDTSYGTELAGIGKTEKHLKEYIERNLTMEDVFLDRFLYRDFLKLSPDGVQLTKVSFMTDGGGAVFRRRAAEAVWDDMNLNLYEELQGWMQVVRSEELDTRDVAAEKKELDRELNSYDGMRKQISEKQWVTVAVNNPTDALERARSEGILKWVIEDPESLSARTVHRENLISTRMEYDKINQGNMELSKLSAEKQLLERFFFQEYLTRYMGYYGAESEEDALRYQLEYLIAGKESDPENLSYVVNRLCAIREAANTAYIMSDQDKCGAAELLASALASLMTIPEATMVLKYIILFGWAFAESLYDVKCLMAGGKVPLMKNKDTWHYGLDAAFSSQEEEGSSFPLGLSYTDYLRILLTLTDEDTLTARAMNMVEADMRQTPGNEAFRLDGCVDGLEACVRIKSAYGYGCEITRNKAYLTQ